MASPCEVLLDGLTKDQARPLADIAFGEAHRVEQKWSRYRTDNLIHAINQANGQAVAVDEETARLLDFGSWLHEQTEGRFDLTSGVLRQVWRFDGGSQWPTQARVSEVMKRVGWSKVRWDGKSLQMKPGMELDFGGIGKEYAVDRTLALLAAATVTPVLVNFGGDLAANAPPLDGRPWQVGVDADGRGTAVAQIQLRRGGIATSGDVYRYLMHKGRRYSHVLNARTGWPIADAPHTVTVAAESCTAAGALTTTAILLGPGAEAYLKSVGADYYVSNQPAVG